MNRAAKGLLVGAGAGILDVIPMFWQHLRWDANLSAFCFWTVAGFFIATSRLSWPAAVRGIGIALLVLAPTAVLIAAEEPASLIPMSVSLVILGSLAGWILSRWIAEDPVLNA